MLPFFYDFYSYSRSTREQNDVTETFIDKNYLFYLKWIKKNVYVSSKCPRNPMCKCFELVVMRDFVVADYTTEPKMK